MIALARDAVVAALGAVLVATGTALAALHHRACRKAETPRTG